MRLLVTATRIGVNATLGLRPRPSTTEARRDSMDAASQIPARPVYAAASVAGAVSPSAATASSASWRLGGRCQQATMPTASSSRFIRSWMCADRPHHADLLLRRRRRQDLAEDEVLQDLVPRGTSLDREVSDAGRPLQLSQRSRSSTGPQPLMRPVEASTNSSSRRSRPSGSEAHQREEVAQGLREVAAVRPLVEGSCAC